MKKSQALGRGLGALLGEMEEVYDNEVPKNSTILDIPLSSIKPNPYQPRKSFDEKALGELSESIKEYGLLQPIVVVEDIDGYILVAGERRFRASKMAKTGTIKAVIATVNEEGMRKQALIENIQREELNAIELAHAYEELLTLHDLTHDELSKVVYKSRTHITNTMRLLQLSQTLQKALLEGKISAGHAKVLVGLSHNDQLLMLNSIVGQKLSVRECETMVKSLKQSEKKADTKRALPRFEFTPLQEHLKQLGLKASAKNNKITIEFSDESEISSFLQKLL